MPRLLSSIRRSARFFNIWPWMVLFLTAFVSNPCSYAQSVSATNQDSVQVDNNGNTLPDRGDTLRYTIQINNPAVYDATSVNLSDVLGAGTTFVPGSVKSTPLAIADEYSTLGNTQLTIDAGNGLLANDTDVENSLVPQALNTGMTVTAVDQAPAAGTVAFNADGSFTYTPPAGVTGITDKFYYTARDADGNVDSGTITISVSGKIWYVDNTYAGGGNDGSSAKPYTSLAPLNNDGSDPDAPGDYIYIFKKSGAAEYDVNDADGFILEANQQLLGQGAALTVGSTTIYPAGDEPVVGNGLGDVIRLADGNTVKGLRLKSTVSAGLAGPSANAATIENVSIDIAGGTSGGVILVDCAGTIDLTDCVISTSVSSTSTAVNISGGNAEITFTNCTIAETGGRAIDVQDRTGNGVTFTGGTIASTNGSGIRVNNNAAGTTHSFANASITGAVADALTLTSNNGATITFNELADITTASGRGLVANDGGTINIANSTPVSISATGKAAIDITGSAGQTSSADGWTFTSLISTNSTAEGVKLTNVNSKVTVNGGTISGADTAGLAVSGGSGNTVFKANITHTDNSPAIAISGGHDGAIDFQTGTIGATNGTGLQFDNADGLYNFTGTTTLNGGDAGIDITNDSGGTFTFNGGTAITSPSGAAFAIDSGTAAVTYSGNITQANDQIAVNILGGHNTGTVTFQTGTISATNGTGIQFNNADGTYNFNGTATLNGGDAGIDILNGSAGTFTFGTGTSITDPSGAAFGLNGGTAGVTYNGNISQSNNAAAVSIQGGHAGGTVTFQTGTIDATNGTGLQFNDADGTYNFNGTATLNGGDAGIDIENGSGGTFTFGTGASITDPSGAAFGLNGGTAGVTYSGNISQSNNAAAVSIQGGHAGGTVTFQTGTVSATGGTGLQFDNADGTYNFNGTAALNGGDAGIDILSGSGGTFTFNSSTSIEGPSGGAVNVDSGNPVVTYSGTIANTAGRAINVEDTTGNTVTFNGSSITDTGSSSHTGTGIRISNVDGNVTVNATTTTLNESDSTGILIEGDTDGTITFNNIAIISPLGAAFNVNDTGDGTSATIDCNNVDIDQSANAYVADIQGLNGGGLDFDSGSVLSATQGTGIRITSNGSGTNTIAFNGNVDIGTSGARLGSDALTMTANGAGTTVTFSNIDVYTDGGRAYVTSGGGTLNVTAGTADTTGATGLEMAGVTAGITFTSLTVANTGVGNEGVDFDSLAGTITVNAGSSITNAGGNAFDLSGGTVAVTYSGGITQANDAASVIISGGHNTGTVTFQTGTISAANGSGLQFDNADGTYNFNGAATLNGGDAGIDIINGSNGTFTFGTGVSITNPSGIAFNLANSDAAGTYSGNITNGANRAISIASRTGGTFTFQTGTIDANAQGILVNAVTGGAINFNGAVDMDTSTYDAVTLTSNTGGTINFTSLDINSTSGKGVNATGGGTVNITGANNVIVTTTGVPLTVTSTTIGGSGLTFKSISCNGSSTGISLNTTGSSGGLTVTGTGTTGGSGGTLASTTDDAIQLTSTQDVSLKNMNITAPANHGIDASTVTHITIDNCQITNAGNADGEHAMNFANVLGTGGSSCSVINSTFTGFRDSGLWLENTSGTLNMTISNSDFTNSDATEIADFGVQAWAKSGANITLTIDETGGNCLFDNIKGSGIGLYADNDSTILTATITNPDIEDCNDSASTSNGIRIFSGDTAAGAPTVNFTIQDAHIARTYDNAILCYMKQGGTITGTIARAVIGHSTETSSGSADRSAFEYKSVFGTTMGASAITMKDCEIHETCWGAIYASLRNASTLQLSLENNTMDTWSQVGNANGILVQAQETSTMCLDINGNNVSAVGGCPDEIRLRQRDASTFQLERYSGGAADTAAAQTFVNGENNGGVSGSFDENTGGNPAGSGFVGVANNACGTP